MFTNLIESTSHAKEFKRRGSFLLFTTATYVVLFVITGVVSIYAYDARLEQQNLEIVQLLSPQDFLTEQPQPAPTTHQPKATRETNESHVTERAEAMVSVNVPQKPPEGVSTAPNPVVPLPDHGPYAVTGRNREAGLPSGPGSTTGGQFVAPRPAVPVIDDPPPPPADPPKPKIISKGVITGQALTLPQPAYPIIAKQAHIQGVVSIQVLINEEGSVISATPVSGHPTLREAARKAAMQAQFRPTLLSGQPVRVSGVINYDFKLSY